MGEREGGEIDFQIRFDRDISGQFIKAGTGHPSLVLAWFCTRRTMALEGVERGSGEKG